MAKRVEQDQSNPIDHLLEDLNAVDDDEQKKVEGPRVRNKKKRVRKDISAVESRGVCYLSRVPPHMDPSKLRQILCKYGDIQRIYLAPEVQWWSMYGSKTPLLQEMALKILNLTGSSSGCERNWSTFEMIHTKKRNRLEQKKLNDLVYVQFNARLKERQEDTSRDPICTKNMDDAASWLDDMDPETEEVYPGSGLTWGLVEKASDPTAQVQRKQAGSFRGKQFSEGWVEFTKKSVAKNVANMLNGEQIGGKRRSSFYYDILNIKYLSKFKWDDLTSEIANKNHTREQKLTMEISAAKRERDFYMTKVDQSRALKFMKERNQKKQKTVGQESDGGVAHLQESKVIRRFPQNKAVADSDVQNKPKLSNDILAGVFGGSS